MARSAVLALGCALALAIAIPATAAAPAAPAVRSVHGVAGAAGIGDPYFPRAGNGGYDVGHYALALRYVPAGKRLLGTARITAVATEDLSRFDLDLRQPLAVSAVSVDGWPAAARRTGQELVLTPARTLRRGHPFSVVIRYAGTPKTVIDPDGALDGWIPTDDGAFLANEPQGAPSWFPSNDHPLDKATFDISMTVPAGLTAVGNGRLVSQRTAHGASTFRWVEDHPMATYLATATFGHFAVTRGRTADGIPTYVAVDPREAAKAAPALAKLPQIVAYEESVFGRYPFDTVGAIVDHAHNVEYALETQTKPVFDRAPPVTGVVHELAHQWYGDSVSLTRWQDIWLNEGFATYAEWLWTAHTGGPSTARTFAKLYATPASKTELWNPPSGNPMQARNIFATSVYERGAMALQALRARIGDAAFFRTLRGWATGRRYGHGTTAEFVRLAEHESGRDLGHLFRVWLFRPGKPTSW